MEKASLQQSSRNNNFNIIRFAAATFVMVGHMAYIAPGPILSLLQTPIHILGIRTFFLMGGYLISKSWLSDPHPLRYALKRVFRIWPALTFFTLAAVFIAGPLLSELSVSDYFSNPATYYYLRNIRLYITYGLPGVFDNMPYANVVNGSLWSLPVEIFFYMLVPVLMWATGAKRKDRRSFILITTFVVTFCVVKMVCKVCFPDWRYVVYGTDVAHMVEIGPYYLLGVFYAQPRVRRHLNLQVAAFALFLASFLQCPDAINEILVMAVYPYFIFSFALCEKPLFASFGSKIELSYGMYIYGFIIQQSIVWLCLRLGVTLPFWIATVSGILLTLICSYVSFKLIEAPCQKLAKKLLTHFPARRNEGAPAE